LPRPVPCVWPQTDPHGVPPLRPTGFPRRNRGIVGFMRICILPGSSIAQLRNPISFGRNGHATHSDGQTTAFAENPVENHWMMGDVWNRAVIVELFVFPAWPLIQVVFTEGRNLVLRKGTGKGPAGLSSDHSVRLARECWNRASVPVCRKSEPERPTPVRKGHQPLQSPWTRTLTLYGTPHATIPKTSSCAAFARPTTRTTSIICETTPHTICPLMGLFVCIHR